MGVDDAVVCKAGIEDGDEEEEEEEEECNVCANKSLPLRRTRRTTRTRGREITQLSLRRLVSTNMSSRSAMCAPQN